MKLNLAGYYYTRLPVCLRVSWGCDGVLVPLCWVMLGYLPIRYRVLTTIPTQVKYIPRKFSKRSSYKIRLTFNLEFESSYLTYLTTLSLVRPFPDISSKLLSWSWMFEIEVSVKG